MMDTTNSTPSTLEPGIDWELFPNVLFLSACVLGLIGIAVWAIHQRCVIKKIKKDLINLNNKNDDESSTIYCTL